jgi:hypothetical protein
MNSTVTLPLATSDIREPYRLAESVVGDVRHTRVRGSVLRVTAPTAPAPTPSTFGARLLNRF